MLLRTKNCSLVERSGEQDGGGSRAGAGQGEMGGADTSKRRGAPGRSTLPGDLETWLGRRKETRCKGAELGPEEGFCFCC